MGSNRSINLVQHAKVIPDGGYCQGYVDNVGSNTDQTEVHQNEGEDVAQVETHYYGAAAQGELGLDDYVTLWERICGRVVMLCKERGGLQLNIAFCWWLK